MKPILRSLIVILVATAMPYSVAHASAGGEIIKAIGRYLTKETGQEATEQAVKEMTKQVGEELIERTAQKVVREGGKKSFVEVGELVAKHGPEVVRALDNAPEALPVLRLLDELPADEVATAASRLAAGSTGRELATLSMKLGTVALRAEARHPGVGVRFARAFGTDGAELSLRITTDQAVQIGRHVDDIARLPANQQSELLKMISSNAGRFTAFVGRFVQQNPGKVLFTAASTPIILANSAAIFGEGNIVFDKDGNPVLDSKGDPISEHSGVVPDVAKGVVDAVKAPIQTTLYLASGVIVILLAIFGTSKIWKHFRKERLELTTAENAADQS
ncbi:hypothetical protein K2X85_16995 [bacterium]|nr:hypothetical protein [bacterium]